ncbi:HIRA-interacting protein 3 [Centropristis striata]|uniref:HIRA-interacting protein 3 n=1 Tax=Centropristis striata TaxID=184440 RepID=UPI0027E16479|nr:HIRA-interacting protein 3 [Centropristis striata]
MMVSEREAAGIRRFVCGQLRDEPDLSTLTLRILKKRYLAHVGSESLSAEAKNIMKRVVEEELIKMQDNDENSDLETKKPQIKRKREKENDEAISGGEDEGDESRAKKSRRHQSGSSSESEEEEVCKTGSEKSDDDDDEEQVKSESDDACKEANKSEQKTNGKNKQQINSEDSSDEEMNKSEKEKEESDSSGDDSPNEIRIKKTKATKNGETKKEKSPKSSEESESDADKSEKSDKINGNSSDDGEKEEKVEKKNDDSDSDSSSLPSLDDEKDSERKKSPDDKKKKNVQKKEGKKEKKEKSSKGQKDDNKAVVRLKRYISLCGVRLKYKELLADCRSVRSQVACLKKKLEDLGVEGQPSIKKCKKVKLQREETQELADLDVSNIIATKGRPTRRAARQEQLDPPSSAYIRSLNSGSDSDEDNKNGGRRKARDWANLQGIISDDADSN